MHDPRALRLRWPVLPRVLVVGEAALVHQAAEDVHAALGRGGVRLSITRWPIAQRRVIKIAPMHADGVGKRLGSGRT